MTRLIAPLARLTAVAVPLLATLDRFRRPFGEKSMFSIRGGSADLWLPYLGARAIVEHLDPYGPLPRHLVEPSHWPSTYPPTMLILYVPLVWISGSDVEVACQIFYWVNIFALVALSFVVWRLSTRLIGPAHETDSLFLPILIALSLSGLTMFAIDRNQSEIVSAALCWGAVLLFLKEKHGVAMAAVTLAGAIKGYAVPVGVGLLLATRGRKNLVRAIAATTLVSLAVTVPVAPYLKHGFQSMMVRADFGWASVWYNHSFKNAFYQFDPKLGDPGRRTMVVLTCLVVLGSLWRLVAATQQGTNREVTARAILFTGAALALMTGLPLYSGPYNYVLVLPAMILAGTCYPEFLDVLEIDGPFAVALGVAIVSALAFALKLREDKVSLAGVALVMFVLCLGVFAAARTRKVAMNAVRASQSAGVDPPRSDDDAATPFDGRRQRDGGDEAAAC